MDSSCKLCFLIIIVLATCIHEGLSIKCWECRSDTDYKCNDPIDNSTLPLVNCHFLPDDPNSPGVKPTMCRKTRQRVNGNWVIIRGCEILGNPAGVDGNENLCNDRDGCNTGPTVYSNQLVVQFAAVLCFINRFYNG